LLYNFVCTVKYRKIFFNEAVDQRLKETYLEISLHYQINFLEIGTDNNYLHYLVQSVPTYSVKKIITIIKIITAREISRNYPEVKKLLWVSEF